MAISMSFEQKVEISFSAPFRTDIVLDQEKLLGNYEKYCAIVHEQLMKTNAYMKCELDKPQDEETLGLISPDLHGKTAIPPYFIGYKITNNREDLRKQIVNELNGEIKQDLFGDRRKRNVIKRSDITRLKLRFNEFGFGSISVSVELLLNYEEEYQNRIILALASAIKSDKIKSMLESFALDYINEYKLAIPKELFKKLNYDIDFDNLVKQNDVYWTHRLAVFWPTEGINWISRNAIKMIPKFVTDNNSLQWRRNIETILETSDELFVPGVGTSILFVKNDNIETKGRINNVEDIISTSGTFSALALNYYNQLIYFSNLVQKEGRKSKRKFSFFSRSLTNLMSDITDKIHTFYQIKFSLNEYAVQYLSALERDIYEKICEEWKLNRQWEEITFLIDGLKKEYDGAKEFIERRNQITLSIGAFGVAGATFLTGLGDISLYSINYFIFEINNLFELLCLIAIVYFGVSLIKNAIKFVRNKWNQLKNNVVRKS